MNVLLLSAVFGIVMLFGGLFFSSYKAVKNLALLSLLVLLLVNVAEMKGIKLLALSTAGFLKFDQYGLLLSEILIAATFIFVWLSADEMVKVGQHFAEYLALLFFIIAGISLVLSFQSLLILFLGIEIISIPLYILTGSDKRNLKSNEAALKYFLMGSFSTGVMLMGVTLLFGAFGTFSIDMGLATAAVKSPLLIAGMLLLFFAMAFKVSAAPFHFWTPDVYDGSPTVFTSFMATIVKVAVFMAFIKLFESVFAAQVDKWRFWVTVIIALTLLIGNITAVFQQSVKRMMAYSSIAQAGFMLFALYSLNTIGKEGIIVYAASYCIANIGIFAVLTKMTDYTFDGFNGLAAKKPGLAISLTIFFLSLAGIPLTGGFLGKLYMLRSAMEVAGSFWLVLFAVLMAAVSVYYYFRVIQAMYFKSAENADAPVVSKSFCFSLFALAALIILLGLFPDVLIKYLYI
jgi:NADH-quinone oxidoreductase subunit N